MCKIKNPTANSVQGFNKREWRNQLPEGKSFENVPKKNARRILKTSIKVSKEDLFEKVI